MLAVAVLPYLDRRLAAEALGSCRDERIAPLPWDNSEQNLGVARPWRRAAEMVLDGHGDWLIVWSTAIVHSEHGLSRFADALERPVGYPDHPDLPQLVSGVGCGWHWTAIHREVLRIVGLFDDQAFFAYYEDTDWLYRHQLAGLGNLYTSGHVQVEVDPRVNRGDAHSLKRGDVTISMGEASLAYRRKWGGNPGSERYLTPYGLPDADWRTIDLEPERA